MRHFYENRNKASVALNPLVSVFYLFVARGGRNRGNRQTDRPSTVTLAAHARRRGLIIMDLHMEALGICPWLAKG